MSPTVRISIISPLEIILVAGVVGTIIIVLARRSRTAAVTEPVCGKCGYCVIGLTTMTCPECGSDLREVGIITPGQTRAWSRRMRLAMWTLIVPLPAYVLGFLMLSGFGPWRAATTQGRTIFSQSMMAMPPPNLSAINEGRSTTAINSGLSDALASLQTKPLSIAVRAELSGEKIVYQRSQIKLPMDKLKLTMQLGGSSEMNVNLADGSWSIKGGSSGSGFGAGAIAQWLKWQGFTDRVEERAKDIDTAIVEMINGTGGGFTHIGKPAPGAMWTVAHPTSPPFTIWQPIVPQWVIPSAVVVLVWLAGLPFVLRRRGSVPSPLQGEG